MRQYIDSIRNWWFGDRILVMPKFSTPVQTDPGDQTCLLYNGYWVFFLGVKRPGRAANHSPQSSAEFKEKVQPYLYTHCEPSWPVLGWPLPLLSHSIIALRRGSTRLHSAENSLWKRLWTCHMTTEWMTEWINGWMATTRPSEYMKQNTHSNYVGQRPKMQ